MSNFLDSTEFLLLNLGLNLILLLLNTAFFISRKKESSANKLKVLIIILLGVATLIFILDSLPFLTTTSESITSSKKAIFSNIFLFLLGVSTVMFVYSVHDSDDDIILLKKPTFFKSRKGKIKIGRVMKGKHKRHKFFLSLKDLEKHVFICGSTGTGKTTFLQSFLVNFTKHYKIPFMLVEFKGEYHFLQRKIENLLIIRPGENFSINIFNPGSALPEVHAERIFDILKSGKFLDENAEFSPQMEKVLVEILTKVCRNKKFQSWKGFYEYCKDYAKNKKNEIPMLSQTIISITNRIRRFSLGSLKALFDTDHELKIKNIFERNILIDLSSIIRLGGEKEDALFFLNMLLKYLWDKNLTRGAFNFKGIKHVTIVEDTQYFAPKDLTRQNKLTTYLEDIALLQRGTGECLISLATHPDISQEILANCGVLVCFKTHMEKEFLCKLLNLDVEHEDYLSILEEGQCIVRVNSIKRPFLLKVPYISRQWLTISEINNNNKSVLENLDKLNKKNLEKPHEGQKHHFKTIKKKGALYLKKAKYLYGRIMKKYNKKPQNKDLDWIMEKELENHLDQDDENLDGDGKKEKVSDSNEALQNLKNFIQELYEKQESQEEK